MMVSAAVYEIRKMMEKTENTMAAAITSGVLPMSTSERM